MRQRNFLAVFVVSVLAMPCVASDFGDRYPAGSLKTREDSKAALAAAHDETARVDKEFKAREAECYREVLVNNCREKVRKERDVAHREIRRVEVEARDLDRRINAEEQARRKEQAAAGQPGKDAARENKSAEAKAASEQREAAAASRNSKDITPEQAAKNRAEYDAKVKSHAAGEAARQAEATERAANKVEYEQKQVDAARHAQEQEAVRKKREAQRAQRQESQAKQEAAREAVRAKAEEAAAGKN